MGSCSQVQQQDQDESDLDPCGIGNFQRRHQVLVASRPNAELLLPGNVDCRLLLTILL